MVPAWHHWITSEKPEDLPEDQINDRDDSWDTALHVAARMGLTCKVSQLIRRGAQLNLQNNQDQTPLFVAVEGNRHEIVDILLHSGADWGVPNAKGETPLFFAAKFGLGAIVDSILACADVDQPGPRRMSPLCIATLYGHSSVVRSLLKRSANVNFLCGNGWRPVHCAVISSRPDILRLVLAAKPDLSVIDYQGKTAMDYAKKLKAEEMVLMLSRVMDAPKIVSLLPAIARDK